jgi:hypothetical protein
MVPLDQLQAAERGFFEGGWATTKMNAYDQKYYRHWMHEIPPLRNVERSTSLDVHHTILPPTAALSPDVGKLWEAAVPLPEIPGCFILGPEDMILHSAAHLFHDGDLKGGLRDIVDLDALLRHFSQTPDFLPGLLERAQIMDLVRPLYYAFRYTRRYMSTPIPGQLMLKCEVIGAPAFPVMQLMDAMVERAILPKIDCRFSPASAFLNWLSYVRSHHLRMPAYLLLPHLVRKSLRDAE